MLSLRVVNIRCFSLNKNRKSPVRWAHWKLKQVFTKWEAQHFRCNSVAQQSGQAACVCRILVREKAHNFNRTSFPILSGFPLEERNFQFYLENRVRSTFGIISSTSHISMNEPMSDLSMTTQGRDDSNI